MPYIPQDKRSNIDEHVTPIVDYIKSLPVEKQDGALNYAVTRMLNDIYGSKYFDYNRAMGVVSNIQSEFFRRKVAPYEDTKIQENGDI